MPYKYNFDKEQCWFKSKCKNYNNPNECYRGCLTYAVFDYLCYTSQIPKARQYPVQLRPYEYDIDAFCRLRDIKDNIVEWVSGGYNLLIHSSQCGNGKTTWATKMMLRYFSRVVSTCGLTCKGVFVNVPSLLMRCKKAISVKDDELSALLENIATCDLVIWDDICTVKSSEYDYNILYDLINSRIANLKSNIYTSNTNRVNMETIIGERLTSRIFDSEVIEFVGPDERGARVWSNSK